jgi:transposase
MEDAKPATRRRHDDELKRLVLEECNKPGASVARIALSHGLNANLVHRWRRLAQAGPPTGAVTSTFVPLTIEQPTPPANFRIELQRGPVSVVVNWPAPAMSDCAAWLREILR